MAGEAASAPQDQFESHIRAWQLLDYPCCCVAEKRLSLVLRLLSIRPSSQSASPAADRDKKDRP